MKKKTHEFLTDRKVGQNNTQSFQASLKVSIEMFSFKIRALRVTDNTAQVTRTKNHTHTHTHTRTLGLIHKWRDNLFSFSIFPVLSRKGVPAKLFMFMPVEEPTQDYQNSTHSKAPTLATENICTRRGCFYKTRMILQKLSSPKFLWIMGPGDGFSRTVGHAEGNFSCKGKGCWMTSDQERQEHE